MASRRDGLEGAFHIEVDGELKRGENNLEVRVTNLWVNRLIGRVQPGVQLNCVHDDALYRADSPLLPSGTHGSVSIKVY